MFGFFKKKDPVCGMTEEKGKGISKNGEWFCSQQCAKEYEKSHKSHKGHSCCH